MTFNKVNEILKEAGVPGDAKFMSNSRWECCATDMDGIYYSKEENTVIFTQGSKYEDGCDYDGYKLLYKAQSKGD